MTLKLVIRSMWTCLAAVVVIAVLLNSAAAAEVEWRLGSQVGPNDPGTLMLKEYARRVAKRSHGRIHIQVVPLETIGFKYSDALRVMRQGILQMIHIYPYYMSRDEPLLTTFLPNTVLLNRMLNLDIAPVQQKIATKIYAKWNLVPVAWTTLGGSSATQQIVCTKPIDTLKELRTVKLRHFSKIGIEAMNSLGVATETLPSSELYLALKTGVVDCSFYAAVYTKSQSLYEVAHYWSNIGYATIASPNAILVRKDLWTRLPDDLKRVMIGVGKTMYKEEINAWKARKGEKAAEAFLKAHGMTELPPFPEKDREKIRQAILTAWRKHCESIGPEAVSIHRQIMAALKKAERGN